MHPLPDRTRRMAGKLSSISLALMVLLLALVVFLTAHPGLLIEAGFQMVGNPGPWPVGPSAQAGLIAMAWIGIAAVLYTLWHMSRLFNCYARDKALTPEAARDIRRIGQGLIAQALIGLLADTIVGLILSIDAPVGQRMITVSVQVHEVGFALAGGLLLMIGIVMRQAVDVAHENEGFV